MSISRMSLVVPCPNCGAEVKFFLLSSIDADRDPDLREAIVDRTLQQEPCGACGSGVRPPPTFMYFDRAHSLWIAAYAWAKRVEWRVREEQAQTNFQTVYNSGSSIGKRMREAPLRARVTFGWEALREKIVAADLGIDDVALEICKRHWVAAGTMPQYPADGECRLLSVTSDDVVLARVAPVSEQIVELPPIPRQEFEEQLAAALRERELRERLTRGMFVDVERLRTESA